MQENRRHFPWIFTSVKLQNVGFKQKNVDNYFLQEVSFEINNFDEKDCMKMCDFIDLLWEFRMHVLLESYLSLTANSRLLM